MSLAFFEAHDARSRVRAETESGVQLGQTLAANAIARAASEPTPEAAFASIRQELPASVRHIYMRAIPRGVAPGPGRDPTAGLETPSTAPGWFVRWVGAGSRAHRFPIDYQGQEIGYVFLETIPRDELEEVWRDWRNEMGVLAGISFVIILIVVVAVSLAFRPLSALAHAFDRMEEGDFAVRVPSSADPQLRRLALRFNRMAESLQQAVDDNHRLMDRLVSVQEEERKDIAHELHDEFGPSLFAIRADIGAISRWVRKKEARFPEIQERLLSISSLVAQIQRINSRLLERLRPLVLDQMGLSEAIDRLTSEWRDRYPTYDLKVSTGAIGDQDEKAVHALYRAAQECLTNVVRHAEAGRVEVRLAADRDKVTLTVEDDGRGLAPDQRHGFGLLGMAERARAAGGGMSIGPGAQGGTRVVVTVRARGSRR